MTLLRYKILLLAGIMILTSCALNIGKDQRAERLPQSVGEQLLEKGVKNYEEGKYNSAAKNIQDALNAGLDHKADIAKAHKYLAFIACCSGNARRCRDEFSKAFENDRNFTLNEAEVGHPIWGPIYREIRDQQK